MRDNVLRQRIIISIIGIIPTIWIALLLAPYIDKGVLEIIKNIDVLIDSPFKIILCKNSMKTIFWFLLIYGVIVIVYILSRKNYRKQESYGSARWGKVKEICKKYKAENVNNKILTNKFAIGLF